MKYQITPECGVSPEGGQPDFCCIAQHLNAKIEERQRPRLFDSHNPFFEENPELPATLEKEEVEVRPPTASDKARRPTGSVPAVDEDAILVELGIWLSGIVSYLSTANIPTLSVQEKRLPADLAKELRMVRSTFQHCSLLVAKVLSATGGRAARDASVTWNLKYGELHELGSLLRETILLTDALVDSTMLTGAEFQAWETIVSHRLSTFATVNKLIRTAEEEGEKFLPTQLLDLTKGGKVLSGELAELALILPRFGVVLKWLSVVGEMLAADLPLKPALLIFARVNEQIFELTNYINSRLEKMPDKDSEMFTALDAAAYTASIELKKVYSQELSGLATMRQTPAIYARIETAHSLLSEGFQQMLGGFARSIDPQNDVFSLFPNFGEKRDRSLILRGELSEIVALVQAAEHSPEKKAIEAMQKSLQKFMESSSRSLFYKDAETVERFVEEIFATRSNNDLVPILHRFGAYLETLYGQVNLRAVLDKLNTTGER